MPKKKRNYEERDFQNSVLQLNRDENYGWIVYSIPDSRGATARGYPDLTFMHPDSGLMFVAELKATKGRISKEQHVWLTHLSKYMPAHIWRPDDMPQIKYMLSTGDLLGATLYTLVITNVKKPKKKTK